MLQGISEPFPAIGTSTPQAPRPQSGTAEFSREDIRPEPPPNPADILNARLSSTNIATELEQTVIDEIAQRVVRDYESDELSRENWLARNEAAMKLATLVIETKNFPWPNAANIKYPLLATACVQFSSRAYPNIIQGTNIVKAKVTGQDPAGLKAARGMRISEHMNYQITEEMEDWSEEMDDLLVALPIEGCEFKKTYFDSTDGLNVSEHVRPKDLVVNYRAKSLKKASRVTHRIWLYPNDVVGRVRKKIFLDIDFGYPTTIQEPSTDNESPALNDEDAPHLFLEQHRWLDLDGDGYQEPYVCTVHKDTGKLVRIVARWDVEGIARNEKGEITKITPVHYFTRFKFMPSPDGGFYCMGFGTLQSPINEVINSTINQLLDAGTRQNTAGGFIGKGVNLAKGGGGGPIKFAPGEYKQIDYSGDDIRKNVFDLKIPEPSRVLFLLLGSMIGAGKELASVSEVLTGEQSGSNVPATTTLALIEQGLKVFSAIYVRVHRGLKCEFKKLKRLNRLFLDDEVYFTVLDNPRAIKRTDYEDVDLDVQPVSNPDEVSDIQRLIKAQILFGLLGKGYNDDAIRRRHLEALRVPDIEELLPPKGPPPPPDPKIVLESEKISLERDKFELEIVMARGKLLKMRADTLAAIARAEAAEAGPQIEMYKSELAALEKMTSGMFAGGGATGGQMSENGGQNEREWQ
uniref:Putative co-chaperone GroES n=1 Tax=viral metagenome TaxID=1070528 RepID=A0A6M3J218_9ZZZZ